MRKLRGKIVYCLLLIILFNIIVLPISSYAVAVPAKSVISDDFPDSYKPYISALKTKHPNWTIKAFYTNLDWTTVINSEASGTYSRIQNSAFGDAWKRLEAVENSSYNAAGFVLASRSAVEYTMDPRNFLNDEAIFQFRVIDKNVDSDTEVAVNQTIASTPMANTTYANIIKRVGDSQGVSPVFIASRIRQETSCDTVNNGSINGKNAIYPGYYNFFNIGAYDSASGAVQYGINMAHTQGWNTPELAITGGIAWIKNHYIKYGQNTVYFQKFDVANPYGNAEAILAYQYMSNISAPLSESRIAYNGILKAGTLENAFTFYIPIYNNMPSIACPVPSTGYYLDDNTKVYLDDPSDDIADTFRIRSSADDLNTTNIVYRLTQPSDVNQKIILTRLKKGVDTGWDYVEFTVDGNKVAGYIKDSYVFEYTYTKVTGVSLNKTNTILQVGNNEILTATIQPNDAKFKEIKWSSSDKNIATVDNDGKVTGIKEGTATITAKTDDGGFVAKCEVNVTTKAPSIDFTKEQYNVLKDKSMTVEVTTKNTNISEYDLSVENQNIAKIENGKLIGVSSGTTKIIAMLRGTNIKSEVNVKVTDLPRETLTIDSSLTTTDDVLSKIVPGTKASQIKSKIFYANSIELKNMSGRTIEDDALVGTGTIVSIKDAEGNEIYEYTIVVYGDISGDGLIDSLDILKLRQHLIKTITLKGILYEAANTSKTGTVDSLDILRLRQHLLNVKTIEQ